MGLPSNFSYLQAEWIDLLGTVMESCLSAILSNILENVEIDLQCLARNNHF